MINTNIKDRIEFEKRITDALMEKYAALVAAAKDWSETHAKVGWSGHHIVDVRLQEALDALAPKSGQPE